MDAASRQRFLANRGENLFFGRFDTAQQAEAAAAADAAEAQLGAAGYDNAGSAQLYGHRVRLDPHDYPALYWLCRSVHEGFRHIVDLGGATGIKALAFRDGLVAALPLGAGQPAPAGPIRWTVNDVPAMVAEGRRQAADRGDSLGPIELRFTERFDDTQGADVLFASGVLQYLPATLGELLAPWPQAARPRRIVVNTAALHPTTPYFTVNSIGTGFCVYRVQTQAELVRGLASLGYRPRESWPNLGKVLALPGYPELSLGQYSGLCLDRAG